MSRTFGVVDSDGHIFEDDRVLLNYLPEPFRGKKVLLLGPFFPTIDGYHRQARRIMDGREAKLENPNATEWLAYLNEAQISWTVLFPTSGLMFGLISDPAWATALATGYNDWLHSEFLSVSPEQLKGMALIPLQDPAAAVAELRRAVTELGMVGAVLPAAGLPRAFGEKEFWPVYEAAEELGCLLSVHGAPSQGLGLDRFQTLIEVRTLSHGFSQMVQMTSMMLQGVFDAFPRLRVAYCEAGCGWVPYLLERLDLEYGNRPTQAPNLHVPPSEHMRSGRIFVHTELNEKALSRVISDFGEDIFFSASDYPHEPKDDFPEAIEEFLQRDDISESAKRKVLVDNPSRMYGLAAGSTEAVAATAGSGVGQ